MEQIRLDSAGLDWFGFDWIRLYRFDQIRNKSLLGRIDIKDQIGLDQIELGRLMDQIDQKGEREKIRYDKAEKKGQMRQDR